MVPIYSLSTSIFSWSYGMSFREFNLILVMDWLMYHQTVIDFHMKRITFQISNGREVLVVERSNYLSNGMSVVKIQIMVSIQTVKEHFDVFP